MLHTKAMALNNLLQIQDSFIMGFNSSGIAFCCVSGCFCSHIKKSHLKMVESNSNTLWIMPYIGTLETVSIPKGHDQWIEERRFKILAFSVLLPPSFRGFFSSTAVTSIRLNRGDFSRPVATLVAAFHISLSRNLSIIILLHRSVTGKGITMWVNQTAIKVFFWVGNTALHT